MFVVFCIKENIVSFEYGYSNTCIDAKNIKDRDMSLL